MPKVFSIRLLFCTLFALGACAPAAMPAQDGASEQDAASSADTSVEQGPFVCQTYSYECSTRAALEDCEATRSFAQCTRLPLIPCTRSPSAVRLQGDCPSASQACRLTSGSSGYCTHSCTRDADCPLPGGGTGTCDSSGPVETCVRP